MSLADFLKNLDPRKVGFTTLTPRAEAALRLAYKEAVDLNKPYVGVEHILLGLLGLGQGLASRYLCEAGLDLIRVRSEVCSAADTWPEIPAGQRIPYTPRAKDALRLATEEAKALGHNYTGTEHILLVLLAQKEGLAIRVLQKFNVDIDGTRAKIRNDLQPVSETNGN